MTDFDPADQPDECVGCGHLFNPREARYGAYRRPRCHQCASSHNARAAFLRMLVGGPSGPAPPPGNIRPEMRDGFSYEPPAEPKPALRADGRVDLGVVAENRGVDE